MGLALAALAAGAAKAEDLLAPWRWHARLLLLFAPNATDSLLAVQRRLLAAEQTGVGKRDLVVVEVIGDHAPALRDTDGGAALRRQFAIPHGAFSALLIGKDGGEKLREAAPIPSDKLFTVIDAMPMRRAEQAAGR